MMEVAATNINKSVVKKLREWRDSPLLFVTECIHAKPTEQQVEALLAITKTKRLSIRSGHGCGKDCVAVWLAQWFMTTRPFAKVVVTAPTGRQLRDVFFSEFSKWLRQSDVAEEFVVQKDIAFHRESQKEWWLRLISPSVRATREDQAETLAGIHADHLLIIADEASGIPEPTFVPLEGAMTSPDNKAILIGNMTKNKGYFYDTHFNVDIRRDWTTLHWDSRESTIVDKSMPEYFARKYGVDSNVFRIRVEGNPPLEDENTLIPLWTALQCIGNEVEVAEDEPLYLGVDVARYGNDASIILPRQGLKVHPWETFHKLNTIDLGGFIVQTYQDMDASGVAIDVIGVGAGVSDWLQKHNLKNLYQINVSNSSSDLEKYDRLRDELWVKVRENCLLGLYSFPDVKVAGETESLGQQLASELSSVRYKFNKHGGYVVESKKDMKARGVESPNIADALCLTEYFANKATRVFAKDKSSIYPQRRFRDIGMDQGQAWMGF
jgi:phage terminase large subunit